MGKKLTQSAIVAELMHMLECEHGSCGNNTCDIDAATNAGFHLWAIELFSGTGAASDGFKELYAQLGPKFKRDARREADQLVATVEHLDCVHCNAVVWEPELAGFHCESCGADDCRSVPVVQAKPGDKSKRGMHLLNPSDNELEQAKDDAIAKGFDRIYVHTDRTWNAEAPEQRRSQFKLIQGGAA